MVYPTILPLDCPNDHYHPLYREEEQQVTAYVTLVKRWLECPVCHIKGGIVTGGYEESLQHHIQRAVRSWNRKITKLVAKLVHEERIDRMEAGLELDALVGDKIMGLPNEMRGCHQWFEDGSWEEIQSTNEEAFTCLEKDTGSVHIPISVDKLLPCYKEQHMGVDGEYDVWRILPNYSTDISAAWLVVEKLRERCSDFSISEGYNAAFLDKGWFNSCAHTVPLAICLAALKVVS